MKSALLLYYLFYNLLLITSFTTGSGTFILSRWFLLVPLLVFTEHFSEHFPTTFLQRFVDVSTKSDVILIYFLFWIILLFNFCCIFILLFLFIFIFLFIFNFFLSAIRILTLQSPQVERMVAHAVDQNRKNWKSHQIPNLKTRLYFCSLPRSRF